MRFFFLAHSFFRDDAKFSRWDPFLCEFKSCIPSCHSSSKNNIHKCSSHLLWLSFSNQNSLRSLSLSRSQESRRVGRFISILHFVFWVAFCHLRKTHHHLYHFRLLKCIYIYIYIYSGFTNACYFFIFWLDFVFIYMVPSIIYFSVP